MLLEYDGIDIIMVDYVHDQLRGLYGFMLVQTMRSMGYIPQFATG